MRLACLFLALAATAGCAAPAPPATELHSDDFARVRGQYTLADGHVIQVAGTRRHPRIEFDGGPTRSLRPLSHDEFTTPDGCVRVAFTARPNGVVTRVDVTRACPAR